MKTFIFRTFTTLCFGAVLGPISLMAQRPFTVTIPFDFTVGSKSFAAGEYTVRPEAARSVLAIRSAGNRSAIMALTQDVQATRPLSEAKLIFNCYADRYFLWQVWTPGYPGQQLPKSAMEKEIIAKAKMNGSVTLVASTSK